jgi:Carbohydrate esterase, sialic acid-specific acetylesterase
MRSAALLILAAIPALTETNSLPPDLQLFLLIGQSNMAGRGKVESQDREPIPRVWMLNKTMDWVAAIDPMHSDIPAAGVGLGRSFAKVLAKSDPTANIGLIPAAVGGTSLDQWKPGGKLYSEAVRRTRAAMKAGKLRGVLWHQGEGEASDPALASSYRERFSAFIKQLRTDLDAPDVPVIVGQLCQTAPKPFRQVVDEQLTLIPLRVPHSVFVSSEGLKHEEGQVHFNAAELREFGRRYGHAFLILDPTWQPKVGAVGAGVAEESQHK